MLLTLLPKRATAAKANTTSIQHAQRAIVFGSALLRIERLGSLAAQGAVGLLRKSGARKPAGKRAFGPLRRTIDHRSGWFTGSGWRNCVGRGKYGGAHDGGSQVLTKFQAQVPEPLGQDLEAFLSPGRVRDPAVGVLFVIFIREDGLKGPTMQIQIQNICGAERWGGQG